MAHPKRKQSKTRRDKRRTHYKASSQQLGYLSNNWGNSFIRIELIGLKESFITKVKLLWKKML